MNENSSLDRQAAALLWNEVAPTLGPAIANSIRKMGLPKATAYAPSPELRRRVRARTSSSVREALLRDESLHEDIAQETAVQFWSGVERGRVPRDASRGWVFRIAQRVAWRLASARAVEFLTALESRDERVDAADLAHAPNDVEAEVSSRLERASLLRAVAALTQDEVKVLTAKLEGDDAYAELALELGMPVGTLRVQACRLMKRLKSDVRREGAGRDRKEEHDGKERQVPSRRKKAA